MYSLCKATALRADRLCARSCRRLKCVVIMAYSILRIRPLHRHELLNVYVHNERKYDEYNIEQPDNIVGGKYTNKINYYNPRTGTIEDRLNEYANKYNIKGERKDSVVAVEMVMTLTDKNFLIDHYDSTSFQQQTIEWLGRELGIKEDAILSTAIHFDESNPHLHIVAVPCREKAIKWRNQKGSGERKENHFAYREIFNSCKDSFRKLQDRWYEQCNAIYGRYIPVWRGTLKEQQAKEYTQQTNHRLGELREEEKTLTDKIRLLQNLNEQKEIVTKQRELEEQVHIEKDKNSEYRRTNFNSHKNDFFHGL